MAQTAAQSASTVAGLASGTAGISGGDATGLLRTVLAAILTGVRDVFQQRQRVEQWLVATLETVAFTQDAMDHGVAAALALICSSPGPDDLEPGTAELLLPEEGDADPTARLRVVGEVVVSDDTQGLPVEVTIEVAPTTDARLTIRGGGGLLCALLSSELYVNGEPLRLDPSLSESLEPTLEVRALIVTSDVAGETSDDAGEASDDARELTQAPDELTEASDELTEAPDELTEAPDELTEASDELTEAPDDERPPAVEVTLRFFLPAEVLVGLLEARALTFWVGDVASVELFPAESEVAGQLRDAIIGSDEEEPEVPDAVLERLERVEPGP